MLKNHKKTHETMYYLLLLVLIIFIAGTAFLIMPLILVATPAVVYLMTIILGLVFGVFLSYFIKDLDTITHHHHAGIWSVIIISSIINFVSVFIVTTELRNLSGIYSMANPFIVALLFVVSFILPHYFLLHKEKHKGASLWMN